MIEGNPYSDLPLSQTESALSLTQQEFAERLSRADAHIQRSAEWAAEKFQRFPHLATISVDFGIAFFAQFGVTLTWNRNQQEAS